MRNLYVHLFNDCVCGFPNILGGVGMSKDDVNSVTEMALILLGIYFLMYIIVVIL